MYICDCAGARPQSDRETILCNLLLPVINYLRLPTHHLKACIMHSLMGNMKRELKSDEVKPIPIAGKHVSIIQLEDTCCMREARELCCGY